jgi:hypothetical protein
MGRGGELALGVELQHRRRRLRQLGHPGVGQQIQPRRHGVRQ